MKKCWVPKMMGPQNSKSLQNFGFLGVLGALLAKKIKIDHFSQYCFLLVNLSDKQVYLCPSNMMS